MKSLIIILLSICLFTAVVTTAKNYRLISSTGTGSTIYVVVIGAFSVRDNAKNFVSHAAKKFPNAKYEFNPNRNLYYVSILTTQDKPQAVDVVLKLRENTAYKDAWVYQGPSDSPVSDENNSSTVDLKNEETQVVQSEPATTQKSSTAEPRRFKFVLSKAIDNSTLEGSVDVLNAENSRKIGTYKGNVDVQIPAATSTAKKLTLVCNVFGFRKLQREIDFTGRMDEDIIVDENRNIVIPFELVRLQKGDIAVMYNVYFFKDAAIMQPQSQFEVNSLLAMMKENPKAKILIHGHTNGNASGKILSMGDSKNFFSLSGNSAGFGTATELSRQRGEVIKEYLVSNGIEADRMEVKGWGGKRALYDKTSTRAKENVRVEIELVED